MVEHREMLDTCQRSDVAVVEQMQQRSKVLGPLWGVHFEVLGW